MIRLFCLIFLTLIVLNFAAETPSKAETIENDKDDTINSRTPKPDCIKGGEWSEWSGKKCIAIKNCGACSRIKQTRKCLSKKKGCKCIGLSLRHIPCNNNPCHFPDKSCCPGAKIATVDQKLQCVFNS